MILSWGLLLKGQTSYKYCFSRDTVELFAKSNQKRLELQDKYNLSLEEINNLNYTNNLLFKKDSINIKLISIKDEGLIIRDSKIDKLNKANNKQNDMIKIHRVLIVLALIIGLAI